MTRNLKALGLALVAVMALSAMGASAASATNTTSAKFTFGVTAGETAKVDVNKYNTTTTQSELVPCHRSHAQPLPLPAVR